MNRTFKYKTAPFDHQRIVFEQTWAYQYYALFWEMGTGKSKVTIDSAQKLYVEGKIDSMIITAEKGYYLNWPMNEFPAHWPSDIPIRFLNYTSYLTAENRREMNLMLDKKEDTFDVIIVNIEALSRDHGAAFVFVKDFINSHQSTLCVVDESTTIKSHKAGRTMNITRLGNMCQYRRILTGTPITQSPLDLFAQTEFLKKQVLGFGSFTSFKSFYSITVPVEIYTSSGPRLIRQSAGFRELDDLAARIQPFSSRLLKKDCLDLPEKLYAPVYLEATPEQLLHINTLKREAMTIVNNGTVTVENALSILTKSLQIAGGHLKDDDGNVHRLPCNKIERMIEIIKSVPEGKKIIVWGYFREDMLIIAEALENVCPVFEVSGRIPDSAREANLLRFRQFNGKCVFLASPRVAGKSLTITEAEYSIYYSNGFNLEHRLQSEDRNHRIGQRNQVTYYDLICAGTPDTKVVKALHDKEVLSRQVLDKLVAFFED